MDMNFEISENILMVSIVFICIGTLFLCLLFILFCNCHHLTSSEQCRYPNICDGTLNEAQDIDKDESKPLL